MERLETYRAATRGLDAPGLVAWALRTFRTGRVVLASSLSVEDQVLTRMILAADKAARVFTLDTGRLPQETYDTLKATMDRYGFRYEILVPDTASMEALLSEHGPNPFFESLALRRRCCEVRKLEPLRRVLATSDAWICGLRRGQSTTRGEVSPVEWDAENGLFKINPLFDWSEERVWEEIRAHRIPFNPLQEKGFRSLGCAPCTRAVGPGEDLRAGRWWWERPEHRECGLHGRPHPGKTVLQTRETA